MPSAALLASAALVGSPASACNAANCLPSSSPAAARRSTTEPGAPAVRASLASELVAAARVSTAAVVAVPVAAALPDEATSDPPTRSFAPFWPSIAQLPAATTTSAAIPPPISSGVRRLPAGGLAGTLGFSRPRLSGSTAAPFWARRATGGIVGSGGAVTLGCFDAAMTSASLTLFDALVSCPARLNSTSLG